mgnify:CR=1 FL=1
MMGVLMALGWLLLTLLKIAGVLLLILLVLLASSCSAAVRGRLLGGRRPDRPGRCAWAHPAGVPVACAGKACRSRRTERLLGKAESEAPRPPRRAQTEESRRKRGEETEKGDRSAQEGEADAEHPRDHPAGCRAADESGLRLLRVTKIRVCLGVRGEDPAEAARAYGRLNAWLYPSLGVIDRFVYLDFDELRILPDFGSAEPTVADRVSFHLSARLLFIVAAALRVLYESGAKKCWTSSYKVCYNNIVWCILLSRGSFPGK